MTAESRAHTTLQRRIEKLEQHVDDLTRAVERLNEFVLDGRHTDPVVEVYRTAARDGRVPSIDLRGDRS